MKSLQNNGKCENKEITFDVIILLGVHDTWVEPEEPPVFNAPEHILKIHIFNKCTFIEN